MLNKLDKKIDNKYIFYNTPSSLCVISSMCFNLASSLTLVAYSSLWYRYSTCSSVNTFGDYSITLFITIYKLFILHTLALVLSYTIFLTLHLSLNTTKLNTLSLYWWSNSWFNAWICFLFCLNGLINSYFFLPMYWCHCGYLSSPFIIPFRFFDSITYIPVGWINITSI